jgi:hypothetical protein
MNLTGIYLFLVGTVILCRVSLTQANVIICNLSECETTFEACIHAISDSTMTLNAFKNCFDQKRGCAMKCRNRKTSRYFAMDSPISVTKTERTGNKKRKCMSKCKSEFQGCGLDSKTASFEEKFMCFKNYDTKCRKKCGKRNRKLWDLEKSLEKITSELRGTLQ